MKRLWDVLVLTLAANFLLLAGAVGWMYQTGRLDRARVGQVREILFPVPAKPVPTTQPSANEPTTRPSPLDELLAKHAGLPAGQQADFVRQAYDVQLAELDRRSRELTDLKNQIDLANGKLATDRAALDADRKKFTEQQSQAKKTASDQGFQDSLNLYNTMPARQVKTIFMTLSDDAVLQYLQAMEPRTAGKVMKEFKTPEETERAQRILERMRTGATTAGVGK